MGFLSRIFSRSPDPEPTGDALQIAAVEATLQRLRPILHADGGDVRLVAVTREGTVELAWQGACAHCSVSSDTLGLGLEPALKADHDWVRDVVITNS